VVWSKTVFEDSASIAQKHGLTVIELVEALRRIVGCDGEIVDNTRYLGALRNRS